MKPITLAAACILLGTGAHAQISLPTAFDGAGASSPIVFKRVSVTRSVSPEAKVAHGVKAAVVNVLVVVKWADVDDAHLPLDEKKLGRALSKMLGGDIEAQQAYEARHGKKLP